MPGIVRAATVLLFLCASLAASSATAHAQLLQRVVRSRVSAIPGTQVWGKTSTKDVRLTLHFRSRVRPSSLWIGHDHPNGVRFQAEFPGHLVPLPLKFPKEFGGFNEYGELNKGYFVQAAEHDFDRDGTPEIIIAVGNGLADLAVNVVRYRAPRSPQDAGRPENWSLVGSFSGQQKALVEGSALTLPYGTRGLFFQYRWTRGKFVQTAG